MPVMTNEKLSSTDKLIYFHLFGKGDNPFVFTNKEIADEVGVHQISVSNGLKKLEQEGYIKLEYAKKERRIIIVGR